MEDSTNAGAKPLLLVNLLSLLQAHRAVFKQERVDLIRFRGRSRRDGTVPPFDFRSFVTLEEG